MKIRYLLPALILFLLLPSCSSPEAAFPEILSMDSPDGSLTVRAGLSGKGEPVYALERGGEGVVLSSKMGFSLTGGGDLKEGFRLLSTVRPVETDEIWEPVWGEEKEIRNH